MDLISANHGWCLSVSLPFWSWLKYLSLHHVLGKHWILIGSSSQTVFSVLNGCRHLDIKNKLPTLSVVKYRLFVSNHRYIWRELLPFVSRGHWNLPRYVERCREGNSDLRLSFFLLLTKNAICGKTEFHPTYRLNYFTFVVTSWIKRGNNDFSWEWVKWCRLSRPAVNLRRYLCAVSMSLCPFCMLIEFPRFDFDLCVYSSLSILLPALSQPSSPSLCPPSPKWEAN